VALTCLPDTQDGSAETLSCLPEREGGSEPGIGLPSRKSICSRVLGSDLGYPLEGFLLEAQGMWH